MLQGAPLISLATKQELQSSEPAPLHSPVQQTVFKMETNNMSFLFCTRQTHFFPQHIINNIHIIYRGRASQLNRSNKPHNLGVLNTKCQLKDQEEEFSTCGHEKSVCECQGSLKKEEDLGTCT